jgi:RecB family exonuclease
VRRDPAGELPRVAAALLTAPRAAQAPVLAGEEALDAGALSVLVRGLAELEELGEQLEAHELISVLEQLPVRAGVAPGPGIVLLAEPLAVRARRFRTVFVCGLQEGVFPRPGAPDPFLADERRRELAAGSRLRLGLREDALARERYLFYACISRATEQVVLSYSSSDEEGNLALPSPFIADVAELLDSEWAGRRRTRLLADVVWKPGEAPTARDHARALAASAAPALGAPPTPRYELTDAALAQVRHRELASAGALESYADCPVKWLVERELQPERFDLESDPLARGSYMHAVLERLLTRLGGPVTPDSLPRALAILDELAEELPAPVAQGRPAAVRAAARNSIAADLRRYLEHEAASGSGWGLAGLEVRFGFTDEEGSLPALELDGDVRLRGVIDRIDTDGAGRAAVRDYKSGSARAEHPGARWAADRQLQVALYMLAVRQLLGLEPVGGFYQPLGGGDLRPRGAYRDDVDLGAGVVDRDQRSGDELGELLDDAARRAVELAGELRAGRLTPCPETCTRDGCAFPGICRAV